MDTPAVHLTDLTSENTEIVGLNGKAIGHCGYSLPIVRHKPTGLYSVLSLTRKPGPAWSHEAEIREREEAGLATLFQDGIKLFPGWNAENAHQPVVAWLSRLLAGRILHYLKQPTLLLLTKSGPFVFCADRSDIEMMLSHLASTVQIEFDSLLATELPDWALLSEISEAGVQAARERG